MVVEGMQADEREAFEAELARPADPSSPTELDEDAIGWEAVATLAALGGGLGGSQ